MFAVEIDAAVLHILEKPIASIRAQWGASNDQTTSTPEVLSSVEQHIHGKKRCRTDE
jgi:hypothetical protein